MPKSTAETKKPATKPLTVDVLVIGGGLVGGTMACALGDGGIKTAVIDMEDPETAVAPVYDGRCSAIALACQKVFAATGIWQHMMPDVQPIEDIRVSDGDSLFFLHYDHTQIGDEPLGYMAENRVIRRGIFARLKELGDVVTWLAPAHHTALERGPDGVVCTLADGSVIHARLAIAADGRGSKVRQEADIGIRKWDYRQTGIVLTIEHEQPHEAVAHEHFLPAGPFAILPLPDDEKGAHRSSLVWTERGDLAPKILNLPEELFQSELELRFGDFLGEVKPVGPRFAYPLTIQYADAYTDRRLALIGDAAHGMHPIAGQGMNMGLRDVAALAELVIEARRLGLDVGGSSVLDDYTRWRRFDNMLMLGLTDVLNRMFSNDLAPIRIARDVGLAVVDKMPGLKKHLMKHAMGQVGVLPRLMKGESI